MTRRKKRNAITLVSLLIALAALIGFYYWYSHRPVKEAPQEDITTIDLVTIDTTQISSLHYVMDDADLMLIKQDGVWVSKDEPGRPINQDYVKAILNAINDIKADRVINENPENLADFGLVPPKSFLEITQNDGTVTTLKIGAVAGKSLGYYGMVNEDGKVYLLPIEMGTALQYNNTEMTDIKKAPEITAANITSISITNRDGEDYEVKLDESDELDNTGNKMYNWKIPEPYGEGYSADYSKVQEILPNYTTFNFIKNADYSGTNFEKYGLDDPASTIDISFNTGETADTPAEYKLYVGNKDEDGNYYVRVDGNSSVYTLSAATVDKMLKIDAFSLMNHYICMPNIKTVDQVIFDIEGTTYTMDINHTTKKNDDGTEEDVSAYYYNGKEAIAEEFTSLYMTMISAKYDGDLREEVNTDGLTPYLTMSYHIFGDNDKTVTASFLPYNDSFFLVKKAEGARFLVDKRKIEDIANAVRSFTGTK